MASMASLEAPNLAFDDFGWSQAMKLPIFSRWEKGVVKTTSSFTSQKVYVTFFGG